jgi:endoglucanase
MGAQGVGYWHTSGNQILDSNGKRVRIAGINWYGFETSGEVVHGLYAQDYQVILNTIHAEGYNTIRLPFSNQMVESPIVPANISSANSTGPINTDLKGLNSLQVMDKIISAAGTLGLKVILDNHRSEAGNSNEANGLWYTGAYPESKWIADWQTLTTRYKSIVDAKGNPVVIGMDLRNEPHELSGSAKTGACWTGDSWTNGCPTTNTAQNWPAAAGRAGQAIQAINPGLLIMVEGTDCYSGDCGWQGANLEGAAKYPVTLPVASHLVYSAHDYGPNLSGQAWFTSSTTNATLTAAWTKYWAYLSTEGVAPVWLGELGTTNTATDIESNADGSQGQWFSGLVTFLANQPNIQWTYWALNGEDSYGLLDSNYDAVPASALKQQLLASIEFPLSGVGGTSPVATCSAVAAVPTSLTATAFGAVQLAWAPVAPQANCSVSYAVFRSTTSGFKASASNQIASGLSTTSYSDTSTSAATSYYYVVESVDGFGSSNQSAQASAKTPAVTSGAGCHVVYAVTSSWSGGFQGSISIQNTGSTSLNGWTLQWTFPNNQQVSDLWNGVESQSGEKVTITNESYNGSVAAGGTVTGIGFTASVGTTNAAPTSFTVNGVACK